MSRRRVRWLIISLAIMGVVVMLSICFLCCKHSNFNFRFGLPGKDKDGELVSDSIRLRAPDKQL